MTRRGFATMPPERLREVSARGRVAALASRARNVAASRSARDAIRQARELLRLRAMIRRGFGSRGFDTRPLWVRALEGRRAA